MGCDIHLFVERKVDGKWISADKWTPYPYREEGDVKQFWVAYDDRFYRDRNYDLFGMLANVRNGVWGDGFNPIAAPKGLPCDVSPEVKREYSDWGEDGHSHSWLTLAELKAYDWEGQKTIHRGWVDAEQFQVFEAAGKPKSYSASVSGMSVRHISNDLMREVIQAGISQRSLYTQVEWEESYYESAKKFVDNVIPKLDALSYGKPENVRIVFWFDN